MQWEDPALSGLQISEHIEMQRRGWFRERAAWAAMALMILAAVLGLFGNGLISTVSVEGDGELLTVTYDRFARYGGDSVLEVVVDSAAFDGDSFSVTVGRDYLDSMKIEDISPQPVDASLSRRSATYTFSTPSAPTGSVRFDMTPADVGSLDGTIRLADEADVASFSQFLYP